MFPEIFHNIGKKLGLEQKPLEQKPKKTIFYERVGIVLYPDTDKSKGLDHKVSSIIALSLHQNPLSIENLINLTNIRLEDFGEKTEDYQFSPVNLQAIRKHLNYLSRHGIATQEQDGGWALTESGKEIVDFLIGKPRTKEQKLKDLFELIGLEALNLEGDELEEFAQNGEKFLPIIAASANRDTTRPVDFSSINTELDRKAREEVTENLRQAWENFKTAGGNG